MRNAVVAQTCRENPCRSSEIVRIAVETIVWSSAARNIASIRPVSIVTICLWLRAPLLVVVPASTVDDVVIGPSPVICDTFPSVSYPRARPFLLAGRQGDRRCPSPRRAGGDQVDSHASLDRTTGERQFVARARIGATTSASRCR